MGPPGALDNDTTARANQLFRQLEFLERRYYREPEVFRRILEHDSISINAKVFFWLSNNPGSASILLQPSHSGIKTLWLSIPGVLNAENILQLLQQLGDAVPAEIYVFGVQIAPNLADWDNLHEWLFGQGDRHKITIYSNVDKVNYLSPLIVEGLEINCNPSRRNNDVAQIYPICSHGALLSTLIAKCIADPSLSISPPKIEMNVPYLEKFEDWWSVVPGLSHPNVYSSVGILGRYESLPFESIQRIVKQALQLIIQKQKVPALYAVTSYQEGLLPKHHDENAMTPPVALILEPGGVKFWLTCLEVRGNIGHAVLNIQSQSKIDLFLGSPHLTLLLALAPVALLFLDSGSNFIKVIIKEVSTAEDEKIRELLSDYLAEVLQVNWWKSRGSTLYELCNSFQTQPKIKLTEENVKRWCDYAAMLNQCPKAVRSSGSFFRLLSHLRHSVAQSKLIDWARQKDDKLVKHIEDIVQKLKPDQPEFSSTNPSSE